MVENWDSMLLQCRNEFSQLRNAKQVPQNAKCTRWDIVGRREHSTAHFETASIFL